MRSSINDSICISVQIFKHVHQYLTFSSNWIMQYCEFFHFVTQTEHTLSLNWALQMVHRGRVNLSALILRSKIPFSPELEPLELFAPGVYWNNRKANVTWATTIKSNPQRRWCSVTWTFSTWTPPLEASKFKQETSCSFPALGHSRSSGNSRRQSSGVCRNTKNLKEMKN